MRRSRYGSGRANSGGGGGAPCSVGCMVMVTLAMIILTVLSSDLLFVLKRSIHHRRKDDPKPHEVGRLQVRPETQKDDAAPLFEVPQDGKRKKHKACPVDFQNDTVLLQEPPLNPRFKQFDLSYVTYEHHQESKFGGHPTLQEWDTAFYARSQRLHCGFVSGRNGSSGYDIDKRDWEWMGTCKYVVSSAIFGNWDEIKSPEENEVRQESKENVCFAMFVDQASLDGMISDGRQPDENGKVGLWKVILVHNMPFIDPRRTGKIPKLLPHRLFQSARYSLWIDSKLRLRVDPIKIFERFLWRTGYEYAIANHYARHCLHDEVLRNKKLNKYSHTAIDAQYLAYLEDGMDPHNESDPLGLMPSQVPEGSVIIRAHTPMSNLFSCLWFNEVDRWTSRDQISFGYTFQRLNRVNPQAQFYLGMFKDCERKALVKVFRHRGEDAAIAKQRREAEAAREAAAARDERQWEKREEVGEMVDRVREGTDGAEANQDDDRRNDRQTEGHVFLRDEVLRKRGRVALTSDERPAVEVNRSVFLRLSEMDVGRDNEGHR